MKRRILLVFFLLIVTIFSLFPLTSKVYAATPSASYNAGLDAILVTGSGICNLTWLNSTIANSVILNNVSSAPPYVWFLNCSLFVNSATVILYISDNDTSELRVNSFTNKIRQVRWKGPATFEKCKIVGWENTGVDTDLNNGRSNLFGNYSKGCDFETVEFGYLGNGTDIQPWYNQGKGASIYILYNLGFAVEIDNCTLHNCTQVFIRGNTDILIDDCTFQDFHTPNCLRLDYSASINLDDTVFEGNNATGLYLYYCNKDGPYTFENVNITNQEKPENSTVIYISQCTGLYFDKMSINHCGNTTVYLAWNNYNVTFNQLYMNDTGKSIYTGFDTRGNSTDIENRLVSITNSVFNETDRINLRYVDKGLLRNVTINGNFVSRYALVSGTNFTIANCSVNKVKYDAISVFGDSIIENCTVNQADVGIALVGGNPYQYRPIQNITVRHNTLLNCTTGYDAWCAGMRVSGDEFQSQLRYASNILIENNTIEGGNIGILLYKGCRDVIIRNNNISLTEWGMGNCYVPVGMTDMHPSQRNSSDVRVNAGINVCRMLAISWNWTDHKRFRHEDITIGNNQLNGTYMQAYIWIDKGEIFDEDVLAAEINSSQFSDDYFRYEFTDSYYGGSIIYANPDNPIYRYQRADRPVVDYGPPEWITTTVWYLSLNTTHFGFRVNATANQTQSPVNNVTLAWYSTYLTYYQNNPNDNVTRWFKLQTYSKNKYAVRFQTYFGILRITYTSIASSGVNTTWYAITQSLGSPSQVTINDVIDTEKKHWDYNKATNTLTLNWTFASQVIVVIDWGIPTKPLLPLLFILGMIGLVALFGGPIYAIYKIKHKEYYWGMVNGLIYTVLGIALFIAWVWT